MKHIILEYTKVRVGVMRKCFCYQPMVCGRLQKAVGLFPDKGEGNLEYFRANFAAVTMDNGDIFVIRKTPLEGIEVFREKEKQHG